MTTGIDFLVLGAARSGTTAYAHALNCHPAVFCAMEVVQHNERHNRIKFPQDFQRRCENRTAMMPKQLITLVNEKAGRAEFIGNKNPAYDLSLRRRLKENARSKLIFVYRAPQQFLASWNKRALDGSDISWHPGRRGAFGVLSVLTYLATLQKYAPECLVVPYRAFSSRVIETTTRSVRYLGVEEPIPAAGQEALARIQLTAKSLHGVSRPILQNEADLLRRMNFADLDIILERDEPFLYSGVRGKIEKYLQSISGVWGQALVEAIIQYDDPQAAKYLFKLLHQPAVAKLLATEARKSPRLRRYLNAVPRALKLRKLLLRQSEIALCERYVSQMQISYAI